MKKNTPTDTAFVLAPGHWLGAWAWDDVASHLSDRGHLAFPVTLSGLDLDDIQRTERTPADQADSLRAAVTTARADASTVILVVHSGAGFAASVLLDQDPTLVDRVVYVDSGPTSDGSAFDASLALEVHEVALPPFAQLDASLEGLSERALERFRQRAVPMPAPVMRTPVRLQNDARRDVPTTIIACSYPSAVVMQMAQSGHPMMAEVAALRDLELIDLPTGHWPMWSRPADLAATLAAAAGVSRAERA
ncbi:MAG: alpha/beta hydrolase [Candidatus Microbacterium colombiense]|nr:MAG: alpha/beta hydrolase [Microbacterium sp.]